MEFAHIKRTNPSLTKKQISAKLGVSPKKIDRVRQDHEVSFLWRYSTPLKEAQLLKPKEGQYSCSKCERRFKNKTTYDKHRLSSIHSTIQSTTSSCCAERDTVPASRKEKKKRGVRGGRLHEDNDEDDLDKKAEKLLREAANK